MLLKKIFLIAIGGSLGANARYWLGILVKHYLGDEFPYATFIVNITGSFLLGMFLTLVSTRYLSLNQGYQWAISVGFFGSYTTFSAFKYICKFSSNFFTCEPVVSQPDLIELENNIPKSFGIFGL